MRDTFVFIFIAIFMLPLAVWKLIDIIILIVKNINITIG